jgi:putative inorganic carbon (hco3(-)) transporter
VTTLTRARHAAARPATRPLAATRLAATRRAAPAGAALALALVAFCALVALVQHFDAPAVLLGAVALLAAATLLVRPELATLLTVLLLYLNVPGILTRRHGVPIVAAGAIVLLLCVPILRALVVRRESLRVDGTMRLMLAYLGVVVLSALAARGRGVALDYALRFVIEGVLVYFLVVNAVRTATTLRRAIWTTLAAGSLLGGLTTYQEATGSFRTEFGGLAERNHEFAEIRQIDPDDPYARELKEEYLRAHGTGGRAQRANGPMNEPNRFGQILVVLLPLALVAFRTARGPWTRAAAIAAAALVACGLVSSDSRGAFVSAALLVALAGVVGWIPRRHLAAGALACAVLVPAVAPEYVVRLASLAGATTLASGAASAEADGAIVERAAAMSAAAHVFLDHPLLGVGAGQFQPFYSVEYQRRGAWATSGEPRPYYAHSLYLQLGAELGLVGLAAFLAIFAHQLRELARARRRWAAERPDLAELATGLAFCLLAYLLAATFLHLGFQRYLWLLAALAGSAVHLLRCAEPAEAA